MDKFPVRKLDSKKTPRNRYGIDDIYFTAINQVAEEKVGTITPSGVELTDAANIDTDASLGTDFYVTLTDNRNFNTPTNPTDWKAIRFWITQDGTGSRTATWSAGFRFSTGLASPTLTTTADFTDLVEFRYNPTYNTWDCIRIVKGFDSTTPP